MLAEDGKIAILGYNEIEFFFRDENKNIKGFKPFQNFFKESEKYFEFDYWQY